MRSPLAGRLLSALAALAGAALLAAGRELPAGALLAVAAVAAFEQRPLAGAAHLLAAFGGLHAAAAAVAGLAVHATRFGDGPHPGALGVAAAGAMLTLAYSSARVRASLPGVDDPLARGEPFAAAALFTVAAAGAVSGESYAALAAIAVACAGATAVRLGFLRFARSRPRA